MISLLKSPASESKAQAHTFEERVIQDDEAHLIQLIYRFAGKKDEWFNLLLSLSNCISIHEALPADHPYQGVSERLLTHIKNAIKISGRLNTGTYTLLNSNALDQLPIPAGIVDSKARVIEINQHAQEIIQQLPQWSIENHHLKLEHIHLKQQIDALIRSKDSFCTLPLSIDDTLNDLEASDSSNHFTKLNRLYLSQIPNPENPEKPYIYFCFSHQRTVLTDSNALKSEFSLTETEALIVMTLLEESSSRHIAKRMKLKDATIRGHLTNIYEKTGVKRKPELIRKIMLKTFNQATRNDQFFSDDHARDLTVSLMDSEKVSTKNLVLEDERNLSYLDINHQNDKEHTHTILILHNMMGSAFEIPPSTYPFLKKQKLRVLVPERPGYGNSSAHEDRSLESFCIDVKQLLDHLGIDKVKLIANSIGGAYALAMAEFIPSRIERIAMVNAIPRLADMLQTKPIPVLVSAVHKSLRFAPFLIDPLLKMAVGRDLEHFYAQQLNYMKPSKEGRAADINLLSQPEFRYYCLKNLKQSAKQGIHIWAEELKLSFAEWPFDVTNKEVEYHFWHGDEDDVISVNAALRLAKEVNTETFFRLKYETHYLYPRHLNSIISALINLDKNIDDQHFNHLDLNVDLNKA